MNVIAEKTRRRLIWERTVSLSPEAKIEWRRERKRAERAKARKLHGDRLNRLERERRQRHQNKRPWSANRIRSALAEIRNRITRIEALWRHHTKQWIVAGFQTMEVWERSTHEGQEHRRLRWQAKAKGHRGSRRRDIQESGAVTREEWVGICASWDYRCAYCSRHRREFRDAARREDIEMDHIIPIDAPGFVHAACNIAPSCKSCNASKGDRDVVEWAALTGRTLSRRVLEMHRALVSHVKETA